MSQKTARLLPEGKTTVIQPPADERFLKPKVKIGVCGIEAPFDRKRWTWLDGLLRIEGVELHVTNANVPDDQMPAWFDSIDYLLVLGDNEGGPMPVKEAIARCKPVIAPNVGWAWEYPCIQYETERELGIIIRRLVPKSEWPEAVNRLLTVVSLAEKEKLNGRHCDEANPPVPQEAGL